MKKPKQKSYLKLDHGTVSPYFEILLTAGFIFSSCTLNKATTTIEMVSPPGLVGNVNIYADYASSRVNVMDSFDPGAFVVSARDSSNHPIVGAIATWSITDAKPSPIPGCSTANLPQPSQLKTATSVTDGGGWANSPEFSLGEVSGPVSLSVSVNQITQKYTLVVLPGDVAQLVSSSGSPQTAPINQHLQQLFSVIAVDSSCNPVSNAPITWSLTSNSGSHFGLQATNTSTSMTNSMGQATSPVIWTGASEGTDSVIASAGSISSSSPFSFTVSAAASASSASPTGISLTTGGVSAAASSGRTLSGSDSLPTAVVQYSPANATLPPIPVNWSVSGPVTSSPVVSGCTPVGPIAPPSFNQVSTSTQSGLAVSPDLYLGTRPGNVIITAQVSKPDNSSYSAATSIAVAAGPASQVIGPSYATVSQTTATIALQVSVADDYCNPVQGASVQWSIKSGATSDLSSTTPSGAFPTTSDQNGVATFTNTFASADTYYEVTATLDNNSTKSYVFRFSMPVMGLSINGPLSLALDSAGRPLWSYFYPLSSGMTTTTPAGLSVTWTTTALGTGIFTSTREGSSSDCLPGKVRDQYETPGGPDPLVLNSNCKDAMTIDNSAQTIYFVPKASGVATLQACITNTTACATTSSLTYP